MQLNKALFSLALLLILVGTAVAESPGPEEFLMEGEDMEAGGELGEYTSMQSGAAGSIQAGICGLSSLVNTVLTAVIFLLIVAAAVVYAGGQLLGAETRARATVWATSMFIGALIAVLIYVVVPFVLETMMGQSIAGCGIQHAS